MSKRVIYCNKCGKRTVHEFISRDCPGQGTSIFRPLLAVASFGISEVSTYKYYQCENCKHLKKVYY